MPRARNIKHSFFTDDDLAEVDPLGRLLFVGMWTLADFNGNLEYRPRKLKAELLPYDDCDVAGLIASLCKSLHVITYNANDRQYLHIRNFKRHQHPHPHEIKKGTDIPDIDDDGSQVIENIDDITSNCKSLHDKSNPSDSRYLIPDTRSLIPDTGYLKTDTPDDESPEVDDPPDRVQKSKSVVEHKQTKSEVHQVFEHWKLRMGKTAQTLLTKKREAKVRARLKDGYSVDTLIAAIDGCARSPHHMGHNDAGTVYDDLELICRDGEHVENFANNIGKVLHVNGVSEQDKRVAHNDAVIQQFLSGEIQ